jgi:hypothetical protein
MKATQHGSPMPPHFRQAKPMGGWAMQAVPASLQRLPAQQGAPLTPHEPQTAPAVPGAPLQVNPGVGQAAVSSAPTGQQGSPLPPQPHFPFWQLPYWMPW